MIDTIESVDPSDLNEELVEVPGENRTFTVLAMASIPPPPPETPSPPPRSRTHSTLSNSEGQPQPDSSTNPDDPDSETRTASTIRYLKEENVQILTPRRREHLSSDNTLYTLYQQRLTNYRMAAGQKRRLPDQTDASARKKTKGSPECVILD